MMSGPTRLVLRNMVWLVLIVVTVVFILIEPRLISVRILMNVLEHSSILGILVIGMTLCLLTGRFDLSTESTLGLTALVGAWMVSTNANFGSEWYLPAPLVIVLMLAMGAAIGAVNSLFILKLKVNAFIVTLAMLLALRGFTYVFTDAKSMYDMPDGYIALGSHSVAGMLPFSGDSLPGALRPRPCLPRPHARRPRSLCHRRQPVGGLRCRHPGGPAHLRGLRGLRHAGCPGGLGARRPAPAVTINLGQGMVFEVFAAAVIGGVSLAGGKGTMLGPLGGVLLLGVIATGLSVLPISAFWVDAARGIVILAAVVLWRVTEIFEERWRTGTVQ